MDDIEPVKGGEGDGMGSDPVPGWVAEGEIS